MTPAVVQVDNPAAYHARTGLVSGELILEGLKATSFSFDEHTGPGKLTLFDGNKVVDTLGLSVPGPFSVPRVAQVGSSVYIDNMDNFTGGHQLFRHG
jgi:hypothetical protein